MIDKLIQKKYFPLLLFFFAFGLYAINNQNISIYILDEAKNSVCASEMLEEGGLFKPTFNSELRTDKPPLHYFFMMVSYSVFGVNEWAARFFSAIFGALTIMISFLYTRKFLNRKTAFYTVLVLLSSIHLCIQFHLAVPDPYLIFFLCWSLFLFYSALKTNKLCHKLLMYIAIGLATLTKGPVAIGIPGLIFLLFLIFSRQFKWNVIKKLMPFTGVCIVLAITLPWFIKNGLETNWEWTKDFFLKHNISRYSSPMEGHSGIFLLPGLFVITGLLPFSVFIVPAVRHAWKNRSNQFILLCMITALTIIIFFSISSTKLPNYTIPSYPFIAVMLAYFLDSAPITKLKLKPWLAGLLVITAALPIAGYLAIKADISVYPARNSAWWLVVLPVGTMASFLLLLKKEVRKSFLVLGFSFILASVIFFIIIYPSIYSNNPVDRSISLIMGKEAAYYKHYNPSYSFYLKEKVKELEANEIETFFNENPEGILISREAQIREIELPDGCEIIFSGRDIFEYPTTVLIARKQR